ncbi:MAG: GTP-binding protein [Neomegalonema sp.]|nr:GTP-binding protein [Neomegalonema sp.]
MTDAISARIPVTILTGFLGAGKTSLLKQILRDPRFADSAVIINEFGEIALDHELVESADEQILETTAGCLCCTVQGDVRRTVLGLIERMRSGALRPFSRLVIETTGLADPAPVLHGFMNDATIQQRVALNGILTVVDCVNAEATLDRFEEARRQVACADMLLLSKSDLAVDPASLRDLQALRTRLHRINPTAQMMDLDKDDLDPLALFSIAAHDAQGDAPNVVDWLRFEHGEGHGAGAHAGHEHAHRHAHSHTHDVNRHGDDIQAHCIAFELPLGPKGFWNALDRLRAFQGQNLLRLKGLVALNDAPDEPILLHGVQHVFNPPARLEAWPSPDKRTRIVVITKAVPREEIEGIFAPLQSDGTASSQEQMAP